MIDINKLDTDTKIIKTPSEVIIEMINLCSNLKLPESTYGLQILLLEAFKLGKQYRDFGGKG